MEANVGDQIRHIYGMGSTSLNPMGKRTLEWDLNDWKWDGELFVATPVNCKPLSYRSRQFLPETGVSSNSSLTCSDDVNMESDGRERELLQSIRGVVGESGEAGNLSLKLGGHGGPGGDMDVRNWDAGSGKRSKIVGVGGANGSVCQVEDCGADLSKAKDYHRRHKVCEMHSKATRALVGNVMQRFCQQCSRFHALQEFDEGKRSCRRRLAGHNKRRRKTNPLNVAPGTSISDDQSNSYLLLSLLKILADLHSNKSDHTKNQDLLSHLLRSLVENKSANGGNNISEAVSALLSNGQQGLPNFGEQLTTTAVQEMPLKGSPSADISPPPSTLISIKDSPPSYSVAPSAAVGRIKPTNFDLNDVYVDSDDGTEDLEAFHIPSNNGTSSPGCPSWMQQEVHNSSPPQVSRNSDSGSAQSPLSSSRGDQIRTDRIVFKLFGKEPSDFPLMLRTQILDWLAHTPTDIESYIRPGCIVLTIYLRLAEFVWDELCLDLTSSLSRLVDVSEDSFWSTGWVYMRVQDQVAFIYNGHVVIDATLPYTSTASRILSVKPIAIPVAEKVSFSIKGFNVSPPNSRLLCALEGQYLALENIPESPEASSSHNSSDKRQVVNYSCSIPTIVGRGFVEVEDNGLGNDFYPFIVAESDICSEIRMLESTLELKWTDTDEMSKKGELDAQSDAIEFIQEMGWLLRRTQMRSKLDYSDRKTEEIFDFDRLKWLVEFALDHEWCAVVKKLLNILFDGTVGSGEHDSVVAAVADIGILHRAVRRNSRPLVELLLRYVPEGTSSNSVVKGHFLFTPSATGPAGLTPLHIGAGRDGAEAVLDALTDDPEMVGIEAWKNARDSTGASPEDYARLRGHYSYIHLVQRKISKKSVTPSHVVLDIPNTLISDSKPNKTDTTITEKSTFQIAKFPMRTGLGPCKICEQKLIFRTVNTSMAYKPAMLSMVVTVAAVCVCVALLFKSCPEVLYVFHPFRWENLEYGSS